MKDEWIRAAASTQPFGGTSRHGRNIEGGYEMQTRYTIEELDALINACVYFTDHIEPRFYAGNIGGRDGVSVDDDYVHRMMDWVAETDKGLLESLGFANDNIVYFRLGRNAKQMMNDGGFRKYLRNKTMMQRLEYARMWAPIFISLLAAVVSIFAWLAPKANSNRIDGLGAQVNELRSDQEQTKAMVTTIKGRLETIPSHQPTPTPTLSGR